MAALHLLANIKNVSSFVTQMQSFSDIQDQWAARDDTRKLFVHVNIRSVDIR